MPKLQCSVSEEFAKFASSIVDERNQIQNLPRVKSANQLIPLALIAYANTLFVRDIPDSIKEEASDVSTRKPGPQKKKPIESHALFDERPGTWLSNVAIATGCSVVSCGDKSLSLAGCHVPSTAVVAALEAGWGAIPEAKQTQNDPDHPGLPGIRFIPPGIDLAPKATSAPPPMALADVGAWISETSILQKEQVVLSDCRVVEYDAKATIPGDMIRIHKANTSSDKPDQKTFAILKSIAGAQSMAYQLGWTMRKETKNGSPGILLIPPRVKLTYEIAPGRTVPVTQ